MVCALCGVVWVDVADYCRRGCRLGVPWVGRHNVYAAFTSYDSSILIGSQWQR